jgi:hypothetical protein
MKLSKPPLLQAQQPLRDFFHFWNDDEKKIIVSMILQKGANACIARHLNIFYKTFLCWS